MPGKSQGRALYLPGLKSRSFGALLHGKPQVGDTVTCKVPIETYFSQAPPNAPTLFEPGMPAKVVSIPPKVWMYPKGAPLPPGVDRSPYFLCCELLGGHDRVGLNFCNAVVVEPTEEKPHE